MKKKLALFLAITSLLCCSCESGSQTDGTTTTTPKISTTTTTSEAPTLTTTTTDNEATVTTTTTTAQTSVTSEDPTTSEEENTTTPPDSTTTEPSDTTASSGSTTTPQTSITTTQTTTATTTTPQTTVTPSTTTTATTSYTEMTKTTMYATTSVNVRSGAGTSYNILGRLSANQSVTVIGTSGNWYAIQFNGKTGFVSKSYLTKNKETTTTTSKPSTGGFSSPHAYGTDPYLLDLLEYYGITEWISSTAYTTDYTVITDNYEAQIKKFVENANGRTIYSFGDPNRIYGALGLCYEIPVEEYVWTEADCYRLFDELRVYADSVGYDKLYLPTEVTPFDGTINSYRGWVNYDCTGLIATGGGFLNQSNTFENNYNYFLNQYKNYIDSCNDTNNVYVGGYSFSITLTTLKDFNKLCKLWGWPYEPGYDNYDADEETAFVFIKNDQTNAGWWLNE